jgi:amidase/aspartyl-tRNA(Asn)/glutamyl-tRNA(Gln) amidotransferase subunit A
MQMNNEILSAAQTARLVKSGEMSALEATDAAIERIEQKNPHLNAVIFKDYDGARQKARELDARLARKETVGAMAGVPTLMKDLFDFKPGWPSTMGGVPALKNFVPDFWSTFPKRIEAADAILIGKTNAPALGFNAATDNWLFGATRNPFDLARNPGGSSGGSAAAVAAGLVPVAGGSDAGGSIRIPASWSGVAGFQGSQGRVPMVIRPDAFSGTSPFIYEGPIARTVEDLALAMSVLSGHEPCDPFSNPQEIDFLSAAQATSLEGIRIGYTPDFGTYPVEVGVTAVTDAAVQAFADAGAIIVPLDIKLPFDHQALTDMWCRLICAGSFGIIQGLKAGGIDLLKDHSEQVPEALKYWMDVASNQSLIQMQADQVMRTAVYDSFAGAFASVDLIVSPTTTALPVLNRETGKTTGPSSINGVAINPLIGWCPTYLTNLIGHPAASVPAGLSGGLPVGLHIMGRRHADLDVMRAAACFERVRPWAEHYRAL